MAAVVAAEATTVESSGVTVVGAIMVRVGPVAEGMAVIVASEAWTAVAKSTTKESSTRIGFRAGGREGLAQPKQDAQRENKEYSLHCDFWKT